MQPHVNAEKYYETTYVSCESYWILIALNLCVNATNVSVVLLFQKRVDSSPYETTED